MQVTKDESELMTISSNEESGKSIPNFTPDDEYEKNGSDEENEEDEIKFFTVR